MIINVETNFNGPIGSIINNIFAPVGSGEIIYINTGTSGGGGTGVAYLEDGYSLSYISGLVNNLTFGKSFYNPAEISKQFISLGSPEFPITIDASVLKNSQYLYFENCYINKNILSFPSFTGDLSVGGIISSVNITGLYFPKLKYLANSLTINIIPTGSDLIEFDFSSLEDIFSPESYYTLYLGVALDYSLVPPVVFSSFTGSLNQINSSLNLSFPNLLVTNSLPSMATNATLFLENVSMFTNGISSFSNYTIVAPNLTGVTASLFTIGNRVDQNLPSLLKTNDIVIDFTLGTGIIRLPSVVEVSGIFFSQYKDGYLDMPSLTRSSSLVCGLDNGLIYAEILPALTVISGHVNTPDYAYISIAGLGAQSFSLPSLTIIDTDYPFQLEFPVYTGLRLPLEDKLYRCGSLNIYGCGTIDSVNFSNLHTIGALESYGSINISSLDYCTGMYFPALENIYVSSMEISAPLNPINFANFLQICLNASHSEAITVNLYNAALTKDEYLNAAPDIATYASSLGWSIFINSESVT